MKKCEQTGKIEKIKTHLVGNKFAGEKGAKQKSRIARSGNGDDEFSAFSYFFSAPSRQYNTALATIREHTRRFSHAHVERIKYLFY